MTMDTDEIQEHVARIVREILQDIDAAVVLEDADIENASEADRLKILQGVRNADIWFEWELESVELPND